MLLLAGLAYGLGLSGPFVFDDAVNLEPLTRWIRGDLSWQRVVFDNASGLLGRPVSMGSFLLNVWLLGPYTWGFKLGNVLIHLTNGVLVFVLFSTLLQKGALVRGTAPSAARWLPGLGAAIWLVHPLLVSTVLYVVQRMALLSALFTLLAMISYLKGRIAWSEGRKSRALWLLALAVPACSVLAALSKENGALAPALCALIELLVFAPPERRRRSATAHLFIFSMLLLPLMVAMALTLFQHPAIVGGYDNRTFTLGERLLTQGRVLWSYVGSLLLPFGPRLGLYHDDYPISHGLLDPPTTATAILGWLGILMFAWRMRRTIPGFALGTAIFLVGQALESSVFPLLMYFEHRNYLPAVGAIWAFVSLATWGGMRIRQHMHHGPQLFAISAVALLLVLTSATAARSSVWRSHRSMLAQGLAYHPNSRWLRVEIAQDAMQRTPPDPTAAHAAIDPLMLSAEPSTRRMAGIWQVLIDCSSGSPAGDASLEVAFGGRAQAIEADLLLPFEAVADGIRSHPCENLGKRQMADLLVSMLDNAEVPADEFNLRRLRFKAAQLYLTVGLPDSALRQAKMAYVGDSGDVPVGALIVALDLRGGRLDQAAVLLEELEARVPVDDRSGRTMLASLQKQLDDAIADSKQSTVR